MKAWPSAVIATFACAAAFARGADGRLDVVFAPNNSLPAIVTRGGEIDVALRENAELRIESPAGSFALRQSPAQSLRGLVHVRATLDAEAPAGTYTLIAKTATTEDRNFRSVVVVAAPPESYRVAVWSNLRVGDPQNADSSLFRVSAQINAGQAALVLVTGDLTAGGTPDQFRRALDLLNDCAAPTLVVPGTIDLASGRAQEYLNVRPIAVPFSPDGFLLCPAASPPVLGDDEGRLYPERRRIRAARWSIGVGLSAGHSDLRRAMTVLVDDPLDYVLGAPDLTADQTSPWGRARFFAQSPDRGGLQWFTASSPGLARYVEQAPVSK